MDWFYSQMVFIHSLLAWCSLTLFLIRGLAFQFGAEWSMDVRLRAVVFGVDTMLTVCGLSLWGSIGYSLTRDTWLTAKLLALVGYTVCAHWAMGRGEFRLLGYLLALLQLAYMMGVSITRSPWLGLA